MKTLLTTITILLWSVSIQAQQYPELVLVKGGSYNIGESYGGPYVEQPEIKVTLSDFYMAITEVTVKQYRTYCKATNTSMPDTPYWGWQDHHPIVNITWDDAMAYCKWLSKRLDKTVTLPTEAQWEYAAKGGINNNYFTYSGSDHLEYAAWFDEIGGSGTKAVATKKPNTLGIYDLSGNVAEWCLDWYADTYKIKKTKDPKGPKKGKYRVLRGGSWRDYDTFCSVTFRWSDNPQNVVSENGFRVVVK